MKMFEMPEIQVEIFAVEDVITVSGSCSGDVLPLG